jgi:surface carbohydrate biosynthesis protein
MLVAHALNKKGAQAFLIPMYQQHIDVPLLKLDAIVINYLRLNNLELLKEYRRLGIKVFVLDTEGGLLAESGPRTPENWARFARDNDLDLTCDGYFFWGHRLRNAFAKFTRIESGLLVTTGCPRYDVAHRKWQGLLKYPRQSYILINTNYPVINPKFGSTIEQEIRNAVNAGLDRSFFEKWIIDATIARDKFMEVIDSICSSFSEKSFLLRSHPFENENYYRERLKAHKNLVVESLGEVHEVIQNCEKMIHLNCGTAVDARILGKRPISLEFINSPILKNYCPLPSRVSVGVNSLLDLEKEILHSSEEPRASETYREYIEPDFGINDGSAAERVSRSVIEILGNSTGSRSYFSSIMGSKRKVQMRTIAQGFAGNIFGTKRVELFRSLFDRNRSDKAISSDSIQTLASTIAKMDGFTEAISNVANVRHPITRTPLSSVGVGPK